VVVDDAFRFVTSHTGAPISTEKTNSDKMVTVDEEVSNSSDIQGFKENCSYKQSSQQQQKQQKQTTLFSSRVSSEPFWIWNIEETKVADIVKNGDCYFNHIIGLPKKNGEDKPFFDYEKLLFEIH
jgi:hypothetical protein